MENYESVLSLLQKLEHDIVTRERGYNIIDSEFPTENLPKNDYEIYKERKSAVEKKFADSWKKHLSELDLLCKQIRKNQPKLSMLTEQQINLSTRFPARLVLGQLQAEYANMNIVLPKEVDFPFSKAVYIDDKSNITAIHQLLLRLMYTVPVGKLEINVFDPNGLGKSISVFNTLLKNERLFPYKRILTSADDLKVILQQAVAHIQNLQQNYFNLENRNWVSLNKHYCNKKSDTYKFLLPCKVFIFFDVPEMFNSDDIRSLRIIAEHGKDCGVLLLFSFSQDNINLPEHERNNVIKESKRIISDYSIPLTEIMPNIGNEAKIERISLKEFGDKMPKIEVLGGLLDAYGERINNLSDTSSAFENAVEVPTLFTENSSELLTTPLGMGDNGDYARFAIGDASGVHHTLVGGISGSGKSNLLHILLLGLCSRYSPDELNLYLLDFKEGVEFNIYANPVKLPHAKLVATESDVEYGITVLEHLEEELERRGSLVKQYGVTDFKGYRKLNTGEKMPRILLIVDEFQVLLTGTGKLGERARFLIADLAKRGRSFGINLLLSTQSLHGVDVDSSQFLCRIALLCREEDSRLLLGQNNISASQIKNTETTRKAIINNDAGSVSGNIQFSVPRADLNNIKSTVKKLNKEWTSIGNCVDTKVYNGQFLPFMPKVDLYEKVIGTQTALLLGEVMDFNSEQFTIAFENKIGNNLVVCGDDNDVRNGILASIAHSLEVSGKVDEIVYVGENGLSGSAKLSIKRNLLDLGLEEILNTLPAQKRVVILDNINLVRESDLQFGQPQKATCPLGFNFMELLENGPKQGTFIILIADKIRGFTENYKPFVAHFEKRIGFSLTREDVSMLITGSAGYVSIIPDAVMRQNRALFAEDGVVKTWFKPYTEATND